MVVIGMLAAGRSRMTTPDFDFTDSAPAEVVAAPVVGAEMDAIAAPASVGPQLPAWAPAVDLPPLDPWAAAPEHSFETADRPAARPEDYQLPALTIGDEVDDETIAEAAGIRNVLWSAGFPAHEGAALMEFMVEASRAVSDLDDAAFELQLRETQGTLRQQLGDAEFDRCSKALAGLFADLNQQSGGKLNDYLDDHAHLLVQPLVMSRLLAHAGRLEQRRRG